MRSSEKVPGGKLIYIDVSARDGKVSAVSITGDFFLHPEERITALENSLVGIRLDEGEEFVENLLKRALNGAKLIGATPRDLARIFKKAVSS